MKSLWLAFVLFSVVAQAQQTGCTTGNCTDGKGRYVYPNGDRYIGEFKAGKRTGRGVYHYSNGNIYQGQFLEDKRHGYGTYRWVGGDVFIGEYRDDQRHGEGTYYYVNGKKEEGIWQNGQLFKLKTPEPPKVDTVKATDPFANTHQTANATFLEHTVASKDTFKRLALVVGNSEYTNVPLRNPVNDARAIAEELQRSGFDVMLYTNVPQKELKVAIRDFGQKLKERGGIGLFYYAGHGLQIDGRNFLVPVDADIQKVQDVEFESVDISRILVEMEYAANSMNILILDACRDNPYKKEFEASGRNQSGLASINSAPPNSLIAFSTAPGATAQDGTGEHGLYTQELLKAMRIEGLKLEDVFKKVRSQVRSLSDSEQIPWETSSIETDFYFKYK